MRDTCAEPGGGQHEPPEEPCKQDDPDLHVLVVPRQRERRRAERDGGATHLPRERTRHPPHRERDDADGDELEHAHHGNERVVEAAEGVGEDDHQDGRGQGEAEPREERAQRARAQESDRDADLAARRAGQRLAERHDVGVRRFVEPLPPHDVLASEVAEMRDGSAE